MSGRVAGGRTRLGGSSESRAVSSSGDSSGTSSGASFPFSSVGTGILIDSLALAHDKRALRVSLALESTESHRLQSPACWLPDRIREKRAASETEHGLRLAGCVVAADYSFQCAAPTSDSPAFAAAAG